MALARRLGVPPPISPDMADRRRNALDSIWLSAEVATTWTARAAEPGTSRREAARLRRLAAHEHRRIKRLTTVALANGATDDEIAAARRVAVRP